MYAVRRVADLIKFVHCFKPVIHRKDAMDFACRTVLMIPLVCAKIVGLAVLVIYMMAAFGNLSDPVL